MKGTRPPNAAPEARVLPYQRSAAPRLFALMFAAATVLAVLAILLAAPAYTQARGYEFTKVADSAEDGFDPFGFGCTSINNRGDIAFRAGRVAPDGFNTIPGIYRVNATDGSLTTIVENQKRFQTIGFNPSMNDLGQVSFAASLDATDRQTDNNIENILRGDGGKLTTIASTANEFDSFGFDTSINNNGEVAFKAELDDGDEGLFSGRGDRKSGVTTHYLTSNSDFDGSDSRPAINNAGNMAFDESVNFDSGIFVGREGTFQTIAAPDPDVFVEKPVLNDSGTAAFERTFFDEATQVTEIVTGSGGSITTVADTRGEFSSFGFRSPSLNNSGDVAFLATLDDSSTTGIFVGPDPVADRVIATGDTLDGDTVQNLGFCEEGLNDSGELAFRTEFLDPVTFETRVAVFRATPLS